MEHTLVESVVTSMSGALRSRTTSALVVLTPPPLADDKVCQGLPHASETRYRHLTDHLSPPLQLAHCRHQLGRVAWRNAAALLQDRCQLAIWYVPDMQLLCGKHDVLEQMVTAVWQQRSNLEITLHFIDHANRWQVVGHVWQRQRRTRKRERKARDSGRRPAYAPPAGFCVANSMKCGCGRTASRSSGTYSSRLSSSSLRGRPHSHHMRRMCSLHGCWLSNCHL
jgi:hypothetical protein